MMSGHGRLTFDGNVMQTLLLIQSQYVLKMIGVLTTFLHPNVGWIFLSPTLQQERKSVIFGTPLTLKSLYTTTASYKISLNGTLATTAKVRQT